MLPSLCQHNLQSPDAGLTGSILLFSIGAPRTFSKGRSAWTKRILIRWMFRSVLWKKKTSMPLQ